jgi:hypothetical protein
MIIDNINKYIPNLWRLIKFSFKLSCILIIFTIIGYSSNLISNRNCNKKIENHIIHVLNLCNKGRLEQYKAYVDSCNKYYIKPNYHLNLPENLEKDDIHWISELIESRFPVTTTVKLFGYEFNAPWFIQYKQFDHKRTHLPYAYYYSSKWELPFIVKEYYGLMYEDMFGNGGVNFYLCVFGLTFEIYERHLWIS